jgi:hypothetical protein
MEEHKKPMEQTFCSVHQVNDELLKLATDLEDNKL